MEERYNGWRNYETWCINLYLTNDYGTYQMIEEYKERLCNEGYNREETIYCLKEYISYLLKELIEIDTISFDLTADLIAHAIDKCDFYEIAEIW